MLLFTFVQLVLFFPGLYVVADAEVRLGTGKSRLLVPDHGFVRHDQMDDFYPENPRDMVLIGITSFTGCCIPRFTANNNEIGWWFFPNGTEIPKIQTQGFWTSRYKKEIYLFRRGSRGVASGIYRCDIPVSVDVNETLYVGLYPSGGNPRVTSVQFSLTSDYTVTETVEFNVTCKSEGGPATTVTWTRNGNTLDLSGGTFKFTATRRLDDPVTAAYTLILSVSGRLGGVYRCQVAKDGPGVSGDPMNSSMELEVKAANPPTDLTAEQKNRTTVRVSWTPPTSSESVTGYQIYYMATESQGTRGEYVYVTITVTTPEADYKILHDLQAGLTYSITMVALSEHLPSEVVGPITIFIKALPTDPMVIAMEVTTTSVLLQLSQQGGVNISNQTDSLEIAFQYTMGTLHNGFCSDYQHSDNFTLNNGSTNQYNITGLQEDSTYNITIRAENATGKSAPSEVMITTLQAAPSGIPQEVTVVDTTSTKITVQWKELPCIDRNGDITGYTVRYNVPGCNNVILHSDTLVATLVELSPFANYSIEVAAVNDNGTGPFSTPVYMRTHGDAPSRTPQEVTIVDTTSTKITIQWQELPCSDRNVDITGYTVRYYSISGSNITLRNYSDTLVATLVDLIPFTIYSIEVAAVNDNGTGPFSTPVYMRTHREKPQVDSTPAIIGGVFGAIGTAIILLILTVVGVAKYRAHKLMSSQKDVRETAKTECVAFESARSENLQACEYEVPMKQCTAYGVIQSTVRNPENPAPVYESVS